MCYTCSVLCKPVKRLLTNADIEKRRAVVKKNVTYSTSLHPGELTVTRYGRISRAPARLV